MMRSPEREYSPKNYSDQKQRFKSSKIPKESKHHATTKKKSIVGLTGDRYSTKSNRVAQSIDLRSSNQTGSVLVNKSSVVSKHLSGSDMSGKSLSRASVPNKKKKSKA